MSNPILDIVAIVIVGLLVYVAAVFFAKSRFGPASAAVDKELDYLDEQTFPYKTYTKYLRSRYREAWLAKVGSLSEKIDNMQHSSLLLGRSSIELGTLRSRNEKLKTFLLGFRYEYIKAEAKRHKDFFERAKLDEDQMAAVVKDDAHNLIIAAAGSGKTRALTARIALLIERGVPPEKILALAYTRAAAAEMEGRLSSQYAIEAAKVRTLHAFSRDLAKKSPDYRSGVASQAEQSKFIRLAAEELASQDRDFAVKLLRFAVEFKKAEERQQHEFPTAKQYYEYQLHQEYETLTLQRVKSVAEREIGNFLFLNGVKFEYEAQADWADKSLDYSDYQPDFFLPDYDLWIEHWAVDRNGNVPDWFSAGTFANPSERYRAGMEWKREQFKKNNHRLVESFNYQWTEGTLIPDLRRQLEQNGVTLEDVPMDEILKRIDTLIHRDPLYELMFSFVAKAKTNGMSVSAIENRLADRGRQWTNKQRDFASLMMPILREYEQQLKDRNMLDFSVMINLAVQVAQKDRGELSNRYPHILVDEFQDITDPQLELIQCISSGREEESTLFCVGDYRQNIFSFAGSNVNNILDFDERFPYSEKTSLSTNYRCPRNVVEASNAIMIGRKEREPRVVAASTQIHPIRVIEKTDKTRYEDWEFLSAKELLLELLGKKKVDEEILVLARYNFRLEDLRIAFPDHDKSGLSFKSIHSAKGTEADYVLLLGCVGECSASPRTSSKRTCWTS